MWGIFAGTTAPYLKRFSLDKDLLLELKKEFTLRPMDRAMNTVEAEEPNRHRFRGCGGLRERPVIRPSRFSQAI